MPRHPAAPDPKTRSAKRLLLRLAFATALLLAVAIMKYGIFFKQMCGPYAVYRTRFGLYFCEFNSEADPDFYCSHKVKGLSGYFLLRDLTQSECGAAVPLRW